MFTNYYFFISQFKFLPGSRVSAMKVKTSIPNVAEPYNIKSRDRFITHLYFCFYIREFIWSNFACHENLNVDINVMTSVTKHSCLNNLANESNNGFSYDMRTLQSTFNTKVWFQNKHPSNRENNKGKLFALREESFLVNLVLWGNGE